MNRVSLRSYSLRLTTKIFGTNKAKPKPSLTDAIASVSMEYGALDRIMSHRALTRLQTDTRVGTIEVKIRKLDNELQMYKSQMAKLRDGPGKTAVQQRALRTLKQKRMYEGQLMQLQQQAFNMEQAIMTTENLKNTMATVDAMQTANKEMKRQYKNIDIDKIEVGASSSWLVAYPEQNIHYDMEDLIEQANEIQESLGRSYGIPDELDEADLEAGELQSIYAASN
jgi:charged multivesicular body protein 5